MKITVDSVGPVDVYPVGWLAALRSAWRYLTVPHPGGQFSRRFWWRSLRREWLFTVARARQHEWRAVRNEFSGYVAEPRVFPPVDYHRCGTGWTKRRAVRSLRKRLPSDNHRADGSV